MERGRQIQKLADADEIIRHSPTILYRLSAEPGLPMIYVSSNVALLGYGQAPMLSEPTFYRTLVHPDDRARVADDFTKRCASSAPAAAARNPALVNRRRYYRWFEVHRKQILGEGGKPKGIEGELIDITERKRVRSRFRYMARHDFLTGLCNRAVLSKNWSARSPGHVATTIILLFSISTLIISRTSTIRLGHPVGDLLLQAVSEAITGDNSRSRYRGTVRRR